MDLLRSFGSTLPGRSRAVKRKRGPPTRSVKFKIYHLPDGSAVPRFNNCTKKGRDGLLIQHMADGYGNFVTIFVTILF